MKGKACKNKGSRFERQVAKMLRDWSGDNTFQRAFLSRSQGKVIGDIVVPDWFPGAISCKNREEWCLEEIFSGVAGPIRQWWEKIRLEVRARGAPLSINPMLLFTRNRQPVMIACDIGKPTLWMNRVLLFDMRTRIMRFDEWLDANPASQWKGSEK